MSYFYTDLLGSHQGRYTKNFYFGIPAKIRIQSKPAEGVELRHNFKLTKDAAPKKQEGSDVAVAVPSYAIANGTTLKYKYSNALNEKIKLINNSFQFTLNYKPEEYNNQDKTLQLTHASTYEPSSGKLENTETVRFGAPQVGPVRPWFALTFIWNNANATKLVKQSLNFQHDSYNFGYQINHDLENLKFAEAAIVYKKDKLDYYIKGDYLAKLLTLGCSHNHGTKALHSYQLTYDHTHETKGIFGQPVTVKFAGEYALTDDLTFKTGLNAKEDLEFTSSAIHRFDKNLRLIFSDTVNLTKIYTEPSKTNYNFGVYLQWTI